MTSVINKGNNFSSTSGYNICFYWDGISLVVLFSLFMVKGNIRKVAHDVHAVY